MSSSCLILVGLIPNGLYLCSMLEIGVHLDEYSFSLTLKGCQSGVGQGGNACSWISVENVFWEDVFLQNCLSGLFVRCECVELECHVDNGGGEGKKGEMKEVER
ncbi:hypothetical protein Fmac_026488 [Flemingia macrophylla]|uniref:Uncharacterized protein n=1 Tax=Flemingia macrophylla TaxID=520843 RepID=A0ABD1LF15_9FABA